MREKVPNVLILYGTQINKLSYAIHHTLSERTQTMNAKIKKENSLNARMAISEKITNVFFRRQLVLPQPVLLQLPPNALVDRNSGTINAFTTMLLMPPMLVLSPNAHLGPQKILLIDVNLVQEPSLDANMVMKLTVTIKRSIFVFHFHSMVLSFILLLWMPFAVDILGEQARHTQTMIVYNM